MQARSQSLHCRCYPPAHNFQGTPRPPLRWLGSGVAGPGKAVRAQHSAGPSTRKAGGCGGSVRGSGLQLPLPEEGARRQLTLLGSSVPPSLPLPLLCPLPSCRPGHGSEVTLRLWGGPAPTPGGSNLDAVPPTLPCTTRHTAWGPAQLSERKRKCVVVEPQVCGRGTSPTIDTHNGVPPRPPSPCRSLMAPGNRGLFAGPVILPFLEFLKTGVSLLFQLWYNQQFII